MSKGFKWLSGVALGAAVALAGFVGFGAGRERSRNDAASAGSLVRASSGTTWSQPLAVRPASVQTFDPIAASSTTGTVMAAWYEGPGPTVESGSEASTSASDWHGNRIGVVMGSINGGLGHAFVVTHVGDDDQADLHAAVSNQGVGFVAWAATTTGPNGSDSMIAAVRNGRVTKTAYLPLGDHEGVDWLRLTRSGAVEIRFYKGSRQGCGLLGSGGEILRPTTSRGRAPAICSRRLRRRVVDRIDQPRISAPAGRILAPGQPAVTISGNTGALAVWDYYSARDRRDGGLYVSLRRG